MRAKFDSTKYTSWYIDEQGNAYSVSNYRGRDSAEERQLTPCVNKSRGYEYVRTTSRNHQVHRLVAEAFVPNPLDRGYVNHIDGDKTNNHYTNLEWCTMAENAQHAIQTGLTKKMEKNQGKIKYTNQQCREVLERVRQGMRYVDAGSVYGMPYSTVAHLVRGSRRMV